LQEGEHCDRWRMPTLLLVVFLSVIARVAIGSPKATPTRSNLLADPSTLAGDEPRRYERFAMTLWPVARRSPKATRCGELVLRSSFDKISMADRFCRNDGGGSWAHESSGFMVD